MKTILIVDDNQDIRVSVSEGLKGLGCPYKFLEAENGKVAINVLGKEKVDGILLDIMMPEMDGWDVASEVRKNPKTKDIPILFLTAKTDDFSKNIGKITAADYIEKPFKIIDLKRRVEKAIGK